MDEGKSALLGLLILGACIAFMWSRGYRMRRTWKRGIDALEAGDLAVAEKSLQSCVKQSPSFVPARRLLGRTLVALQRFDEAEAQLRLASQFEPRNAEGHLELAMFLANCPPVRPDEAVKSLSTALEFAPAIRATLGHRPEFARLRDDPQFQALLHASAESDSGAG